jgi:hypothetical protein
VDRTLPFGNATFYFRLGLRGGCFLALLSPNMLVGSFELRSSLLVTGQAPLRRRSHRLMVARFTRCRLSFGWWGRHFLVLLSPNMLVSSFMLCNFSPHHWLGTSTVPQSSLAGHSFDVMQLFPL